MEKAKQIFVGALDQFSKLWMVILFLYAPILLFFTILSMISRTSGNITLSYFTRDISAIGGVPFFAGLVSQLGGLLWSAALAVCIFTYFILKRQGTALSRRFLLHSAFLTGLLLFDDFYLFHEDIGPDYLNIGEKAIVLSYLLLCVLYLFINFREILASEYLLLGLALAMFGMSIFIDAADLEDLEEFGWFFSEQFQLFLEDGFKFVGVATWLAYFARYGYQRVMTVKSRIS